MPCAVGLKGVNELDAKSLPVILIVDDIELNRAILSEAFDGLYTVLEAENGEEALRLIENHLDQISAILLDYIMPKVDGFQVLETMNRRDWIKRMPIVMISSDDSDEQVLKGYELGVSDFIGRPFSASIVRRRVANLIDLYRHRDHLEYLVQKQTQKLKQSNLFMIDTLSTVVEFRNGESGLHTRRIRCVSALLLQELARRYPEYGLTEDIIEEISNAAVLHDIGKIAVPENILNKPGKLTAEEFEVMKAHTVKGGDILGDIEHIHDQTYIRYCFDICRHHHERWDGRGYPDGLAGDAIPLSAQVVSLADVYDALTSKRVYKPAYSHDKAIQMILNGECGMFNPRILECLLAYEDRIEREIQKLLEAEAGVMDGGLLKEAK